MNLQFVFRTSGKNQQTENLQETEQLAKAGRLGSYLYYHEQSQILQPAQCLTDAGKLIHASLLLSLGVGVGIRVGESKILYTTST